MFKIFPNFSLPINIGVAIKLRFVEETSLPLKLPVSDAMQLQKSVESRQIYGCLIFLNGSEQIAAFGDGREGSAVSHVVPAEAVGILIAGEQFADQCLQCPFVGSVRRG